MTPEEQLVSLVERYQHYMPGRTVDHEQASRDISAIMDAWAETLKALGDALGVPVVVTDRRDIRRGWFW